MEILKISLADIPPEFKFYFETTDLANDENRGIALNYIFLFKSFSHGVKSMKMNVLHYFQTDINYILCSQDGNNDYFAQKYLASAKFVGRIMKLR